MKHYNLENPVKNLPDVFTKSKTSNNFKILETERRLLEILRGDLANISKMTSIDNAYGKTLDLWGERVGQARGKAPDEQYRIMIKAKIMRSISNGSYPSVVNCLCETFSCKAEEITVIEGDKAGMVENITVPLDRLNKAGLTSQQTLSIIKSLLPIGIEIGDYYLEGTFVFSNIETEYDETMGFADEEGTIGGFFGATESDDTNTVLPI